ncbi:MAG: hypothetical protein OJJ55_19090 [Rhodococcus sp.]|nr:hypothetical protein [Rhodococcus sp. (in: high G+C Gram-positive bacteria)]
MASALRRIELPIPARGLDTNSAPSQVSTEHARELHNAVVNTPTELRVRRGWRNGAAWYSVVSGTKNNIWPYSAYTYDARYLPTSVINLIESSGGYAGGQLNMESGGTLAGAYSGTDRSVFVNWSSVGANGTVALASTDLLRRAGPSVMYDGISYGSADVDGRTYLHMWAGTNNTAHTTGGVTLSNGNYSGTFSSAPAASKVGSLLKVTGGATGPLTGYTYSYRIVSHTAGAAAFVLSQPYGLGESTTNVPNAVGASTTIEVRPGILVAQRCGALASFRERLWVGRHTGTFADEFNRVNWSSPGQFQKFPAASYTYVGDDYEVIMGMATINEVLLIFTHRHTYRVTGYDEDSFSIAPLFTDVGCADPNSIAYYRGEVIFMSEKGLLATDGHNPRPRDLTSDRAGRGVSRAILDALDLDARVGGNPNTSIHTAIVGNGLVVAVQSRTISTVTPRAAWYLNMDTGAWSTWGNVSSSGYRQPWVFTASRGRTFAIAPWQAVDITDCFDQIDAALVNTEKNDTDYTTADAATTTNVLASIQYGDIRLGGGDTVRVRGMQIEHNCHYYAAASSPVVAWAVTMDVDADIDTTSSTVGDVSARYVGNTGAAKLEKYFTDRFTDISFPTEGSVFRVRMEKNAVTPIHSAKVFKVSLLVDGQATMLGRVDNATT